MNCRDFPFATSIWIICLIAGVTGVITNGPLNTVAEVGDQAIFICTSSITLQNWVFARSRDDLGTSSAQNIAINCVIQAGFTTHYEVDRPGGSTNTCNLIVKATTMQQAGIYTCSDTLPGPSAILTAIDPIPVITSNSTIDAVEGETVVFECELNYNGSVAPVPTLRPYFYWTNSSGQNVTSSSDSTTDDMAVSQITVAAKRENSTTAYTCHVYFILNPQNTRDYASNTPTVNISATSSTIEVLFSHPSTTPSTLSTLQTTAVTSIPHPTTTPSTLTTLQSASATSIPLPTTISSTTLPSTPTTSSVTGVITNDPLNAVAEVGGQVIFNCTSSTTQQNWIFAKSRDDLGTSSAQDIAINCVIQPGFETHYEVDRPGGSSNICNLIVNATTLQQAGIYTCKDSVYGPSAILTVIERDPILTHNATGKEVKEHDSVVMECSLNYSGSTTPAPQLQPYFYWTNPGGQTVPTYSNLTTYSTVASQLTVTAGRQEIQSYMCHVYIQLIPPITAGYATNIPTIDSTAASQIIEVRYAPSTPAISSEPDVIAIDNVPCNISVLTCSSEGNPPPTYKWYDSALNILSNNSTLTQAEINRRYRCEAKNTIGTTSTDRNVSQDSCSSSENCCIFPHDDTTTVTGKGCGFEITLFCNATTYPRALYMWKYHECDITLDRAYSPVYGQVRPTGSVSCTAYFNRSLSNYSGSVSFPNGTSRISLKECYTNETVAGKASKNVMRFCDVVLLFPTSVIIVYFVDYV